jgi:hypothetical protein
MGTTMIERCRVVLVAIACMAMTTARPAGDAPTTLRGEPSCGKPGLPDCPLQAWMKSNIVAPKAAGNAELLAKNLMRVSTLAPAGSGWTADWKTIADAGAIAARKADKDGVNAACNACHSKYRKAYREKYRENPVPN